MTLTYIYAESTAVVGPLATYSEPHAYDLCVLHGTRLKVPNGWNVIKAEITNEDIGPSDDDLMVIADAVREVATQSVEKSTSTNVAPSGQQIGRRGHLRSVPN
jgi:hypothetical protein